MAMSWSDWANLKNSGNARLVGDENGGQQWYQVNPDGTMQSLGAGFVPPTPTGFDQFGLSGLQSNLGSDYSNGYKTFDQGLMAVNPQTGQQERVYATQPDSDGQQRYYFESDPQRPANATPAMAGGYSSGNDKSTIVEPAVIGGLAAIGGAAALGAGAGAAGTTAASGGSSAGAGLGGAAAGGETALGSGLSAGLSTGGIGGGALGSGLTAGTTASGIGGGALGSGIGVGAGSAATLGGAAGGGLGALGAGYFAGETAAPVLGGQAAAAGATGLGSASAGASGVGTAGTVAGGATAGAGTWDRIFNGTATAGDWASIAGSLAPGVLGYLGSSQQTDAYKDLANQYMSFGAPSRARYEASYQPGFDITQADPAVKGAMDTSYDSLLRRLSATGGNPYGNPGGLMEAQKYVTQNVALPALQQYRNQNAATGGYGAFSTAAPAVANNAVQSQGNEWNSIGYGIGKALNPSPTISDFTRAFGIRSPV